MLVVAFGGSMSDENELQDDLAEADATIERPRKAGRPAGAKNRSTSRTEIRKRVALHRQRKRELAEAEEEKQLEYEAVLKRQKEQNLVFFGEISSGQNCQTAQEELEIASMFAVAMSIEPIRSGQTIRSFINDVLRHWCEIGTPLLCLTTRTFAEPVKERDPKRFHDMAEIASAYQFPDGVDEAPIQLEEVTTNA
jgi:hypothetical protein